MNVKNVFLRGTGCTGWTLLRARTKGPKPGCDGMEDLTGDLTPSITHALENSVARFMCDGAFCERLNNLSLM